MNIEKLDNYKTKLNQIIDRWNYVKKKNTKSKALFDHYIKKDMIEKCLNLRNLLNIVNVVNVVKELKEDNIILPSL